MKVLITGANGFIGHYLTEELLQAGIKVIATGKGPCRLPFTQSNFTYAEMDFTDHYQVYDVFEMAKPDVVVHTGAMSKPNECEQEQMQAYITNVEGTVTLLNHAEDYKSFFIFLSTDFIFSGDNGPYKEDAPPAPVNYYGTTKMQAEEAVMEYAYAWAIVRTVLVYGKPLGGRDNILTMVQKKLEAGEPMKVVSDQYRTPTYVVDLAKAIGQIIVQKATRTWHISGNEMMTPYEMATRAAALLHLDASLLSKATAADFKEPATRPLRTGFIIDKAEKELNYRPTTFAEGLKKTFSMEDPL